MKALLLQILFFLLNNFFFAHLLETIKKKTHATKTQVYIIPRFPTLNNIRTFAQNALKILTAKIQKKPIPQKKTSATRTPDYLIVSSRQIDKILICRKTTKKNSIFAKKIKNQTFAPLRLCVK